MLGVSIGKGGVGKSWVSGAIAARAALGQRKLHLFDADASNGSLKRFFGDQVERVTVDSSEKLEAWLEAVVWPAGQEGNALVDLGSGAERVFSRWLTEAGVMTVAEEVGVSVTFIHVLDATKDALVPPHAVMQDLQGKGRHILMLNHGRVGGRDSFEAIKAHEVFRKLLDAGAKVIELPRCYASGQLDERNASILSVVRGDPMPPGKTALSPFDRQRALVWYRRMSEALDEVGDWLP